MVRASSLKNLAIIFMFSYFSLAHSMLATSSDNKENTINQYTGNYTFYDSNNNILARLPKSTIYKLSEVIAKSAHFGDRDHFVIDITDRLTDKISELLPESWALFLQYLQAHQKEAESDKNRGAVYQALQNIKHAPPIVLLDLLCFSLRYQFKDITECLMPYIGKIWQHYQTEVNLQDEPSSITSLERLIERIFYSKNIFRSIVNSNRYYYPAFYAASVENIITHDSGVSGVLSVAISSNGRFIVSGSKDGLVKLYDMKTEQVKTIITHNNWVFSVAISSDGRFIVSGSTDKTVKLYNMKTEQVKTIIIHDSGVCNVAISSDGRFIVSGSDDGRVKLYDIKTEQVKDIITHDGSVNRIVISSDGRFIVSGSNDETAKLYDRETGQVKTIITHNYSLNSVAISGDSSFIVSGSNDGTVKLAGNRDKLNYKEFFELIESMQ